MKKKLLLINCVNENRKTTFSSHDLRIPPLSLGVLAALTPDNWDIQIIDEYVDDLVYESADLVCLSAYTSSITRAYEIANYYIQENVKCIIGGIHVSMLPDEAINYATSVVVGEVESVWAEVLNDFEKNTLKKIYKSTSVDTNLIPIPRHDLFSDKYRFAALQTTRGCPMDCNFCTVTKFNGNLYRRRSIDTIVKELKIIKNDLVFFVDDNLLGYSKKDFEWVKNLFRQIIANKINKKWMCFASLNFSDDQELLDLASGSGCYMVMIGIESEDLGALEEYNKYVNIKRPNLNQIIKRIHKAKIMVRGCYIFGAESDNEVTLNKSIKGIIGNNIDLMQVAILTPLPGTDLLKKMRSSGQLLYNDFPKDWDIYDVEHLVFNHKMLAESDIVNAKNAVYRKFYRYRVIIYKFLMTWRETKSLSLAKVALYSNLNFRKIFYEETKISKVFNAFLKKGIFNIYFFVLILMFSN